MTKVEKFFYAHASGSWNPATETPQAGRRRYARQLAKAERHATMEGWHAVWESDVEEPGSEVCLLVDLDGRILQSLAGIEGATARYRRVVMAELSLEELTAMGSRCGR